MAHGGTSFGFWAGANTDATDGTYQPDVTSYDYDAAINEAGQPGEKFNIIRKITLFFAVTHLQPTFFAEAQFFNF